MTYKNHILLGKIIRVHNYDGVVIVKLERSYSDIIPELKSVFIETDGRLVPFFIEFAEQPDKQTFRLQFSGYESDSRIKEFVGSNVFLNESEVKFLHSDTPRYLIDYKVITEDNVIVGIIIETIEHPGHILLNVRTVSGKEILIPFHEDLIRRVDKRNKIIEMIIPEGLADIN